MLDGSENEVTGLLANLFAMEGLETPHPEGEKHYSRSGKLLTPEKSPEVLAAVAKARAALGTHAFSAAFEELLATVGSDGRTPMETLSIAFNKAASGSTTTGFNHADADDGMQKTLAYVLEHFADYNPAKGTFNGWLNMMVGSQIKMILRPKRRMAAIGGGEGEVDVAADARREKIQHGHSWAFDAEEAKLCDVIATHLKQVKDGVQPFPYVVKVAGGVALPREEYAKKRKAIQQLRLLAFMGHFGLGAPKKTHADISKEMEALGVPPVNKNVQNQWHDTMWDALRDWLVQNSDELGISGNMDQILKLFVNFRNKLSQAITGSGQHGRPTCAEDDDSLSGLLTALEGWHAPANS